MRKVGEGGQELLAASRGAPARFYKEQILRGHSWQINMPLAHSLPGSIISRMEGRGQEGRHWRQRENGPKLGTGMKPGTGRKEGMSFTQGHCDCPGQSEHLNPGLSWGEGGRLASPEVGLDYRIGRHIPMLACHF